MTQEELADQSGVSQASLSSIETGHTKSPSVDNLARIARALQCSVDDLSGPTRLPVDPPALRRLIEMGQAALGPQHVEARAKIEQVLRRTWARLSAEERAAEERRLIEMGELAPPDEPHNCSRTAS